MQLRKQAGPSSLNITHRRRVINQINMENDEFVRKLETVNPTVPSQASILKNTEKVSHYFS